MTNIDKSVTTTATNNLVTLPVPKKGIVNRIVIAQESGDLDGFTAALFDTPEAAALAVASAGVTTSLAEANMVVEVLTAANGASRATLFDAYVSYNTTTSDNRNLYLNIRAATAKTFRIRMHILTPQVDD